MRTLHLHQYSLNDIGPRRAQPLLILHANGAWKPPPWARLWPIRNSRSKLLFHLRPFLRHSPVLVVKLGRLTVDLWSWFDSNEGVLSGIAAALVIFGALITVGRSFLFRLFRPDDKQTHLSLTQLSSPSPHPIQFANSDGVNIAYNVQGKTDPTLLVSPGIISNLHVSANLPPIKNTMEALGKFARVINFDKRGQGLSDPISAVATLPERVKDIEAVADSTQSEKFFLMGISEGGPMSIKFAEENPHRVRGLILFGTTAKFIRSEDYPIGISERSLNVTGENWGQGSARDILFPSISREVMDDATYKGFEKLLADKRSIIQIVEYMKTLDVRALLPNLRCPTLVVHFAGDLAVPSRMGRYLADHIPNAEFLEIAGVDHCDLANAPEAIETIRQFMSR